MCAITFSTEEFLNEKHSKQDLFSSKLTIPKFQYSETNDANQKFRVEKVRSRKTFDESLGIALD